MTSLALGSEDGCSKQTILLLVTAAIFLAGVSRCNCGNFPLLLSIDGLRICSAMCESVYLLITYSGSMLGVGG